MSWVSRFIFEVQDSVGIKFDLMGLLVLQCPSYMYISETIP